MRSWTIVLAAALLASTACAGQVRVGDPLPDLAIADWHDVPRALAEFRGEVVAIDFWATWCGICRGTLPALDDLARRHAGDGLRVLAVDVDASRGVADNFLAAQLPTPAVTLLRDPHGDALARFGADGMPALYIVDRGGVVRLVESGYDDDSMARIKARIDALLTPSPAAAVVTPGAAPGRSD